MSEGAGRLTGRRVVVTRSAEQAGPLVARLRDEDAEVVLAPMIAVVDPADGGAALRAAAGRLGSYDWVVLTSANGARRLLAAMGGAFPRPPRVAAVGPATAEVLGAAGVTVDLVPAEAVGEGLLAAFPAPPTEHQGRVLLARAAVARDVVPDGLRAAGWAVDVVDAYRTQPAPLSDEQRAAVVAADVVTFTSPSTVDRLVDAVGPHLPTVVVCIGSVTAEAARRRGLVVAAEAAVPTPAGLVDAVVRATRTAPPSP